jgi:ribonuclease E
MTKRMLIDATHAEETRVVVLDGSRLDDFDVETATKRQLKGNIYLAKVVRVEPSLQAAFVEYGGNRHGFLAFGEIHPDYYQIPVADRQRLLAMEAEDARREAEEEDRAALRSHSRSTSAAVADADPVADEPDNERSSEAAQTEQPAIAEGGEPEAGAPEAAGTGATGTGATGTGAAGTGAAGTETEGSESAGSDSAGSGVDEPEAAATIEAAADALQVRNYKIQEVIRRRQILLVQVVKEERGTKGAALTTYISLAGRYCVLMPNSPRGGGISRKITSATDRKRLKEVTAELEIPAAWA